MSDLQEDIDVWNRKIRFQSPVANGAQHLAPHVMTGGERLAIERVVKAARQVASGTKEWLCQYPEFSDEACLVLHEPGHTRQPRKHSECGWFITIPTTEDTYDA